MIRPPMSKDTNLRARGTKWYGRWKDASGKWREKCLGTRKDVARETLYELQRNVRRTTLGLESEIGQKVPVQDLLDRYLAASHWKPIYKSEVKAALEEMLRGIKTVAELTAGRIEAARDLLKGSARTLNKKAGWALQFCRWLRRTGTAHPPCDKIERLQRADVVNRRPLTREEARRLQEACDGSSAGSSDTSSTSTHTLGRGAGGASGADAHIAEPAAATSTTRAAPVGPIGDLVALLLGTGLRLGEALGLLWSDLTAWGIRVSLKDTRTKKHCRVVPISQELRDRLERLKESRGGDRIIVSERGLPMTVGGSDGALLDRLREAATKAGLSLDGLDFHALRHTYATWAAAAGLSAHQLQALMGWRSLAMADRYVHLEGISLKGVTEKMWQASGNESQNTEKQA